MEVLYILIGVLALATVIILLVKKSQASHEANPPLPTKGKSDLVPSSNTSLSEQNRSGLTVRFESLSALTKTEATALCEITDPKLLARIDNAIPGTLQTMANAGAVNQYRQAVQKTGQLYQAIIPQGAVLSDSKAMEGAVRGIYHGADGIAGHANLVAVDGNIGGGLAAMNVANAAMGAAAMVVGQYYMTQINDQLGEINSELDKIATFQDKEYQSKIYALVAEMQRCSQFQVEIVENEELRKRELDHLKSIEHECAQLLGQANLTLKDFEKKKGLDYSSYEKLVSEAQTWFQYQQILLEVMLKIEELTYALNLGKVSRENCYSMFVPYAKQADEALKALEAWHKETGVSLEIDLDASRRRRQGIEGFFMNIPALFNDELHYKGIPKSTVAMIAKQSEGMYAAVSKGDPDLFREDVRLIAKEGKLYYLPEVKAAGE
jgi:hypothetical protein